MLKELNQETVSPLYVIFILSYSTFVACRVSSEDVRVRLKTKYEHYDCFTPCTGSSSTFFIKHFCGEVRRI